MKDTESERAREKARAAQDNKPKSREVERGGGDEGEDGSRRISDRMHGVKGRDTRLTCSSADFDRGP
jgi:hypothetical protein